MPVTVHVNVPALGETVHLSRSRQNEWRAWDTIAKEPRHLRPSSRCLTLKNIRGTYRLDYSIHNAPTTMLQVSGTGATIEAAAADLDDRLRELVGLVGWSPPF